MAQDLKWTQTPIKHDACAHVLQMKTAQPEPRLDVGQKAVNLQRTLFSALNTNFEFKMQIG